MDDAQTNIVGSGYDALGERFGEWSARVEGDPRDRYLHDLSRHLPDGARVLDLGCGSGLPSTRELASRFAVVGVDLSEAQLELARQNVPDAAFVRGDLARVSFPPASFAAITAFYSISHVPREEHAALFGRAFLWLEPGGLFLATLGAGDDPDWVGDWLGVPMFFSSWDADTNRRLLRSVGFELLQDEIVEIREPEGAVSFLWVLARRPSSRSEPVQTEEPDVVARGAVDREVGEDLADHRAELVAVEREPRADHGVTGLRVDVDDEVAVR
jgi:SAM-dependent methyltransferase